MREVWMNRNGSCFAVFSVLLLLTFASAPSACIGLVAGKFNVNVSVGYSGVGYFYIVNNCEHPMNFTTAAKIYATANEPTPDISISPAAGSMVAHQEQQINVTIDMPSNATVGSSWSGGAAASEVSNSSVPGAANIGVGVLKILTISAIAAPVNYFQYEEVAIVILILVVLAIVLFYLSKRKKKANTGGTAAGPAST